MNYDYINNYEFISKFHLTKPQILPRGSGHKMHMEIKSILLAAKLVLEHKNNNAEAGILLCRQKIG